MARQPGFLDTDERLRWLSKAGDPLERLSAVVGFIILLSIIVHGVTAAPLMERLARRRQAEAEAAAFPEGAAPANPPASKDGD